MSKYLLMIPKTEISIDSAEKLQDNMHKRLGVDALVIRTQFHWGLEELKTMNKHFLQMLGIATAALVLDAALVLFTWWAILKAMEVFK